MAVSVDLDAAAREGVIWQSGSAHSDADELHKCDQLAVHPDGRAVAHPIKKFYCS
jgi:hypothetical protein